MTAAQSSDTPTTAPPVETAPAPSTKTTAPVKRPGLNTDTLALGGFFIAIFAFLAAIFAVGLAARAIDEHREVDARLAAVSGSSAGTQPTAVTVSLKEFAIEPGSLDVASRAVLTVRNNGSVVHNLSVDGTASPMLAAGESAQLDLGGLAPGTYTIRCDVPGHEAAGMKGTLTIA